MNSRLVLLRQSNNVSCRHGISRTCIPNVNVPAKTLKSTGHTNNCTLSWRKAADWKSKYQFRALVSASAEDEANNSQYPQKKTWNYFSEIVCAAFGLYLVWDKWNQKPLGAKAVDKDDLISNSKVPNLPTFSQNNVAEHYDAKTKIWVSFNRGVYDITNFVNKHPGGSRILMAAGGRLEPFWELYPVHKTRDVLKVLETYRIGNLREEDVFDNSESGDAFSGEPLRHPALLTRSLKPFNGETPPVLLKESFYTPKNHLPVPEVDLKSYNIEIEGLNIQNEKVVTLQDIKKLPKIEISATIQCGGNRRTEMGQVKPVAGLGWTGGAIGNAKWGGASLRDVLLSAGFKLEDYETPEKYHIQFEGLDSDPSGECYGASIPLSYIIDGNFQAILAYEMNGKTLPRDHGFPIRIILPGVVGARSVKWLRRIIISDKESQSPWQQRDYKVFSPSVTMDTVDFSTAPAIQDTPVTAYVCSHSSGEKVKKGHVSLEGYAFSGGGRRIVRVEVSKDRGTTWKVVNIINSDSALGTRNWSWVLWQGTIELEKGSNEIWVKAVDSGYNQQPEDYKGMWNYRGLLATAYHKIILDAL